MPSHICFSYNISPALLFSSFLHPPLRGLEPGSSPFFPLGSCWIMGRNCSWFIIGSIHSDAWAAKRVRGPFNPCNTPPSLPQSLPPNDAGTHRERAAYTVYTAMKVHTGTNVVACVCSILSLGLRRSGSLFFSLLTFAFGKTFSGLHIYAPLWVYFYHVIGVCVIACLCVTKCVYVCECVGAGKSGCAQVKSNCVTVCVCNESCIVVTHTNIK